MSDETEDTKVVDEPRTLAEESGLTMADAMRAIQDLNAKFAAQNEENAKLRAAVISQQAMLETINAKRTAARFGAVTIEQRICNSCGAEVKVGERCVVHPRGKINEIGMGTKHNRLQPVIVRQI